MAESSEEKTEQPTERKLQDLRTKGQIPQSKDLLGAAGFVGILLIVWIFSNYYMKTLIEMVQLPSGFFDVNFTEALSEVSPAVAIIICIIIIPILSLSAILIITAAILQNGVIFSVKPITPDIKRLDAVKNFKQMFSRSKLVELAKTLLKTVLFTSTVYFIIKTMLIDFLQIPFYGLDGLLHNLSSSLLMLFITVALLYIAIAIIDIFLQKKLFLHQNKMTKYEVKKDAKEDEGDPFVKVQRREFAIDIVTSEEIEEQVPKANVVIANPTHLAIALYYSKEKTGLPMVVAKGRLRVAKFIVKIANRSDVPIVHNVSLARELYKKVKVNEHIPNELFLPVAELLRWVYLKNQFKKYK